MIGPYAWLDRLSGTAECRVCGAAPAGFLNRCASAGVPILYARPLGEDTLLVTLHQRDAARAEALAIRAGCVLSLEHQSGGRRAAGSVLRRVLPLTLCLLCVLGAFCSKLFIWEMEVTGNEQVSSARILSALAECGIAPGTYWPGHTSDTLRAELLLKLPELAWATVQINGSRAEVVVRERVPRPEIFDADAPVDLVARREGFVTQVQALNGTALIQRGSAAAPGDILIAGAADSAFSGQRQLHALGSVKADTYYELTAILPQNADLREPAGRSKSRWALEIGGKRINFYRNSSICGDSCDKITIIWQCKIKGLFQLPLALVRETTTPYCLHTQPRDENQSCQAMEQLLHEHLMQSVGADGQIMEAHYSRAQADGKLTVCLRARCSENIAVERVREQEENQ